LAINWASAPEELLFDFLRKLFSLCGLAFAAATNKPHIIPNVVREAKNLS